MDNAYLKKSKSDPTFRKRTTVALILYIFLIIWTYIHDEAIVLVQKKGVFPVFRHKTRPKLNGSVWGERGGVPDFGLGSIRFWSKYNNYMLSIF